MCRKARREGFREQDDVQEVRPEVQDEGRTGGLQGRKDALPGASENGVSPSLAAAWRDELLGGTNDIFGKSRQDRERKEREEAAKAKYGEALRTIGQPAVERDFLQRFCDEYGYDPGAARGGRG